MKRTMLFLFCLSLVLLFCGKDVKGYSETGHEDFKKISFVNGGILLKDYSSNVIKDYYKLVSRRGFGWSTYYLNESVKAIYDGQVIFARSNRTSKAIDFEYNLKEMEATTTSVSTTGSVSAKVSGSIKKINTTIGGEGSYEKTKEVESSSSSTSSTSISILIQPETRVTMLLTGEAYVTTGLSKYYLCWMNFRKGTWERVEVSTIYCEIREESL